jgi:HTH-type transcriptional regulator/antitoxin HipB
LWPRGATCEPSATERAREHTDQRVAQFLVRRPSRWRQHHGEATWGRLRRCSPDLPDREDSEAVVTPAHDSSRSGRTVRAASDSCGIFPIGKIASVIKKQQLTPLAAPQRVSSPEELGTIVRQTRKNGGIDQISAAGFAGVGARFFGDLERGKPTLRLGLVLRALQRLGLEVWVAPRGWRPRGGNEPG